MNWRIHNDSFEYKYYVAPTSEEELQEMEEELISLEIFTHGLVSEGEDTTDLEASIVAKRTAFTDAGEHFPNEIFLWGSTIYRI